MQSNKKGNKQDENTLPSLPGRAKAEISILKSCSKKKEFSDQVSVGNKPKFKCYFISGSLIDFTMLMHCVSCRGQCNTLFLNSWAHTFLIVYSSCGTSGPWNTL